MNIADCLGQRVLVCVSDGEPQMTTVAGLAPSGQYVWLQAASTFDDNVGWRHVAYVRVLESFGPSTDTLAALTQQLQPAISSVVSAGPEPAPAAAPTPALTPVSIASTST